MWKTCENGATLVSPFEFIVAYQIETFIPLKDN